VAGAGEEVEGLGYFDALQKRFPDRVRKEVVPDQFERISATQMRDAIKVGDMKGFEKFIPDAAYNKGATKDVFSRLLKIMK
jgi:hypothetical protein